MTIVWPAVIGGFIGLQLSCAVFGAYVAEEKNRHSGWWFVLCLVFGLVALIAIAGIPAMEVETRSLFARDEGVRAWNPLAGPPPQED